MVIFRDSNRLAEAYGLAVTTDFLLTTTMLVFLARYGWRWRMWRLALLGGVLLLEIPLWAANAAKFMSGGWLPIGIALIMVTLMLTWRDGENRVEERRLRKEGSLRDFLAGLRPDLPRLPGAGIYLHSLYSTVPLPLRVNALHNGGIHERIILLHIKSQPVPHVLPGAQCEVTAVKGPVNGIFHVRLSYGFMDVRDPVRDLLAADVEKLVGPLGTATFYAHHLDITEDAARPSLNPLRKLFVKMTKLSASPAWLRTLPEGQLVEYTSRIYL